MERLSALDAAFLFAESEATPMQIGFVGLFEGTLAVDEVAGAIGPRLEMVPKLRERVIFPAGGLGRPRLVEDESFDIARHVLPGDVTEPRNRQAVMDYLGRLFSAPLERDKPLWEIHVINGVSDDRSGGAWPRLYTAVIGEIHHSLADGVSGVRLASILLDSVPSNTTTSRTTASGDRLPQAADGPSWRRLIAAEAGSAIHRFAAPAVGILRAGFHPAVAARYVAAGCLGLASLLPPASLASDIGMIRAVGQRRRIDVSRYPLDALHGVRQDSGATLNEVVLAAVAAGVRSLARSRGYVFDDEVVNILVPATMHRAGEATERFGNSISALLVEIPLGHSRPTTMLAAAMSASRRAQRLHHPVAGRFLLRAAEECPAPFIPALAGLHSHQPFVHMIVTNVPGPSSPLYALGARMVEAYPVVPLGGNLPMNVAVLSYDGYLGIEVTSDPDAVPDVESFTGAMGAMFEELIACCSRPRPRHHARSVA